MLSPGLKKDDINKRNNNNNIPNKPTKQFKALKKIALNQIHKRYGPKSKLKYKYMGFIMETLIFNKNTHLVSTFKDYMIWDYIDEFLKRFYHDNESNERVPKFAKFYQNYLKFFCVPTFKDIFCNDMLHNFSEKKAELFYNANYRKKKESNSIQEDIGIYEESESDEDSDSKTLNSNNIEKTIFNETVKKKIEKYSPINTSMVLPESDTKLKPDDSGLLITSSNEASLVNIMKGMIPPAPPIMKTKNKKISQNLKNKISNVSTNNNLSNCTHHQNGESLSSFRLSQKNLISSTLNKLNSQTLETLLNSQLKNRNKSSRLVKRATNNINLKDNPMTNANNGILKSQIYTNNNLNNNNKIISYMGIYKKKSIPKSRNENKFPEEVVKSQTKTRNFISGSYIMNNNNNNKNNNINYNNNNINPKTSLNNNINNLKNITSINNYNLNYRQILQKSRNQQQSTSINSNMYSKNSFDKINDIKKKLNINILKNNNLEYVLNQLKVHPYCTLKKNSTKKSAQNNNKEKKSEDKKAKKSKVMSTEFLYPPGGEENRRNSTKNRSIASINNPPNEFRANSQSRKFGNSPSDFEFKKKGTNKMIKTSSNIKTNTSKDIKVNKKYISNISYNNQQSDYDKNGNKNKNVIINNKMSFDGIMSNNMNKNNKKINIINNNGPKHIHNVNININNQINIGGKNFHELFNHMSNSNNKHIYSLLKNNNKKSVNYISRNKNQSLDFNSYTINQNNAYSNVGNKMKNEAQNENMNNIYKTQFRMNSGISNNNKNKNKEAKKIKLTNNTLFRSMKSINNNYGNNKY